MSEMWRARKYTCVEFQCSIKMILIGFNQNKSKISSRLEIKIETVGEMLKREPKNRAEFIRYTIEPHICSNTLV